MSNFEERASLHTMWESLGSWEESFDAAVAAVEQDLVGIRRHLHARPEPSGEEVETSRYLHEHLDRLDGRSRIIERGTGVFADLEIGRPSPDSPLIAIRADMDALRLPDQKQVDYRSTRPGIAHACGHDVHSTIVLGAAMAGRRLEAQNGQPAGLRLRLIFQPAEETSEGAEWMVESGALEGVDAILGLHVDPERRVGEVGIRYGVLTAYCEEVDIVVEGHGGHAARPHHTRDPIAAASHLVGMLYEFLPRAVDTRNANVFTIGRISGGYAPNVIPERVEIQGTLRTTDTQSWNTLRERILDVCTGAERATGTRIRCTFESPLKAVENHPRVTAALEEAARRVVGPDAVQFIDRPSLGGEDFAVYLDHVPGAMIRLGCGRPDVARPPYLHSPLFDVDERTIALGVRILVRAALLLGHRPQPEYAI